LDIVRHLAEAMGCEPQFREMPWARILLEIENGTVDVTTSTSWTAGRSEWAHFSVPYRRGEMAVYVRKGMGTSLPLAMLADVKTGNLRLGVIVGYHYGEEFARLVQDPAFADHVEGAVDYENNITKLVHGRVDAYLVEDVGVMIAEARSLGVQDQVERHPLRLPSEELHFMFSKKTISAEQVSAVDGEIQRMKTDGRLQTILSRYLD
jgi:polar amino acid transport system substrate-binding protein